MRRTIVPLKEFNQALIALERQLPLRLVRDIACRIAAAPDRASSFQSGTMHILHTRSYDRYPAFSLFYKFDEQKIYLMHSQLRDELEAHEDEEIWW
jgi:predicted membrane metal-binding protein